MSKKTCCILSVALCLSLLSSAAFAAEGTDATVTGVGAVTLRPAPTRLRMVMALQAFGKSPQVALENLKTRREAIAARLKELKADEQSIAFDTPRVGNSANANSSMGPIVGHAIVESFSDGGIRTYSAPAPNMVPTMPAAPAPSMVPTMPAAPGRGTPVKKLPILYTARVVFRVEWPLADEGPERLAAAAAEIQEKVRSEKLTEGKEPQNLSAEDKELIEEAQMGLAPTQPQWDPSSSGMSSPDGPEFVFVATLSDAQRKKALAEAFAKAKAGAAELAEAAGMRLGQIVSLSRGGAYNINFGRMNYGDNDNLSPLKQLNENENVGKTPEDLEFSIGITANYRLLPPEAKQ